MVTCNVAHREPHRALHAVQARDQLPHVGSDAGPAAVEQLDDDARALPLGHHGEAGLTRVRRRHHHGGESSGGNGEGLARRLLGVAVEGGEGQWPSGRRSSSPKPLRLPTVRAPSRRRTVRPPRRAGRTGRRWCGSSDERPGTHLLLLPVCPPGRGRYGLRRRSDAGRRRHLDARPDADPAGAAVVEGLLGRDGGVRSEPDDHALDRVEAEEAAGAGAAHGRPGRRAGSGRRWRRSRRRSGATAQSAQPKAPRWRTRPRVRSPASALPSPRPSRDGPRGAPRSPARGCPPCRTASSRPRVGRRRSAAGYGCAGRAAPPASIVVAALPVWEGRH